MRSRISFPTPGSRARNFPARRFRARGRPGGPCGQGRSGWLSTSPPGIGPSAQKKGGRSLLFMRGFFDIAARLRVLRKVAPRRLASAATGGFLAPGRRSRLSIRRCLVSPIPTLSPRSFSLFLSFGIIEPRTGRRFLSFPLDSDLPLLLGCAAVFRGLFLFRPYFPNFPQETQDQHGHFQKEFSLIHSFSPTLSTSASASPVARTVCA